VNFAHGFQQQVLQRGVKIRPDEQSVAGGEQVEVRIRNVAAQADDAAPEHHVLEPGDRLGNGFGLRDVHQSDSGGTERAREDAAIQRALHLAWKDRHIDLAGDQRVDGLGVIQVDKPGGCVQSLSRAQHLQDQRPQGGPRLPDGKALATHLRETRDGLGITVEDEDRRVEHPTERLEGLRVFRLGETEGGERRLHARRGVTQQLEVLHRAGSGANLQRDAVACEYPGVLPREVVVRRSCSPAGDGQAMGRQRVHQPIDDVEAGEGDARRGKRDDPGLRQLTPHLEPPA
jgi:hypothetical protein